MGNIAPVHGTHTIGRVTRGPGAIWPQDRYHMVPLILSVRTGIGMHREKTDFYTELRAHCKVAPAATDEEIFGRQIEKYVWADALHNKYVWADALNVTRDLHDVVRLVRGSGKLAGSITGAELSRFLSTRLIH